MKNTEIETRLAAEISNEVPDVLAHILQRCEDRDERTCGVVVLPKKRKNIKWQKPLSAAAAVFALMVGGYFGIGQYRAAYAIESVVMLDVNPSLTLELNKSETVLGVSGANEDGKAILSQITNEGKALEGQKLDAVVEELLTSMTEAGYLDEESCTVLVTVSGADPEKSAALKSRLTASVFDVLTQKGMAGAVLGQSIAEDGGHSGLAEKYGISQGKAELIQKILAKDEGLSFEELAGLSVSELGLLADEWVKSNQLENVILIGKISAEGYVSAEVALDSVFSQSDVSAELGAEVGAEVGVSVGIDGGTLVYDISLKTGDREYRYEVDAKSGLIINWFANSEGGGLSVDGQLNVQEGGKIGIGGEISVGGQGSQQGEAVSPAPEISREGIVRDIIDIIGKIADKAAGA